jgi:hypothetical protein
MIFATNLNGDFTMLKVALALFLLSTTLAMARTHEGTISSIDYGSTADEEHHLYLSDGYVIKVPNQNRKDVKFFEDLKERKKVVRFKTDEERKIESYKVLGTAKFEPMQSLKDEYQPTIFNSIDDAKRIFKNMKTGASSSSQCYNRAHVWSYEGKQNTNLNMMKVFMFYTRKYIREYNFDWWFHVSPFTYVQENGEQVEKVLDRYFTKGPLNMKTWTDIFMKNDVLCPSITKYTDYENHQESEYCYLYKASMYYVQPLDLENLEETGATKTKFLNWEVDRAYRNFNSWW